MTVAFDTYEFINELKQSGLSEVQAKVISDGIKKSTHECKFSFKDELKDFAKKDDLKNFVTKDDLKRELRFLELDLRGEIKQMGNVVTVRVTGLMVLILTIFELLQHFRLH
jgi:hypothetical protein